MTVDLTIEVPIEFLANSSLYVGLEFYLVVTAPIQADALGDIPSATKVELPVRRDPLLKRAKYALLRSRRSR